MAEDDEDLTFPSPSRLSKAPATGLPRFYDFWETHYILGHGWDQFGNRDAAQAEAASLVERLREEFGNRFTVQNQIRATFA